MHIDSFTRGMGTCQDEDTLVAYAAEKDMTIHCGTKKLFNHYFVRENNVNLSI
jgi:hypothetical protein